MLLASEGYIGRSEGWATVFVIGTWSTEKHACDVGERVTASVKAADSEEAGRVCQRGCVTTYMFMQRLNYTRLWGVRERTFTPSTRRGLHGFPAEQLASLTMLHVTL